jgi:hypothetical protein
MIFVRKFVETRWVLVGNPANQLFTLLHLVSFSSYAAKKWHLAENVARDLGKNFIFQSSLTVNYFEQ